MGIYKRKQESKKKRKKERKQELDQENDQEKKVFLFSYFLVFFYKFPPLFVCTLFIIIMSTIFNKICYTRKSRYQGKKHTSHKWTEDRSGANIFATEYIGTEQCIDN